MSDIGSNMTAVRSSRSRWMAALLGALLAGTAGSATGDNANIVRDLAGRVGPIIGSALACADIARSRIQFISDKFQAVIRETSSNEAERDDLSRLLDRYVADGRSAVTVGRTDCRSAERQLADLEQSLAGKAPSPSPSLAAVVAPSSAAAATAPTAPLPQPGPTSTARGVTANEIRFGIVAPFSGPAKELGRQMKLGIDTAFARVNEAGGVEGRLLKLVSADDGYEPARTTDAMKQLYDKEQVFGFIGNVGTPTAAVAIPYALERRTLFFGAFTGSNILRNDPPDRYVFNYRASYAEETATVVHYLIKLRRLQPRQIAVFAQQDSYGDAGFAGVAKAFRALGINDATILRLNYKRNTVDVDDAVNQLKAQKLGDQGGGHGRNLSSRRQIHREDARSVSRDDLFERVVRGLYRACRRTDAAWAALCQRHHRDAGGAGGWRLFERSARIQERAGEIFSRRVAGLRVARRLRCRQRPDPGPEADRPAARYRAADRCSREYAQSRSGPWLSP